MIENDIEKVLAVWGSKNKIFKPSNQKLALDIVDQIAALFSAGNFYYYILNFVTYKMDFVSDGTQTVLGIPPKEFTLNSFFSFIHPEDMSNLYRKERVILNFKHNKITKEEITKYKSVYLIRVVLKDGTEKTLLHQSRAISVSDDGKVQQAMGVHTDVTHLNLPIDYKISFLAHNRSSFYYNEDTDSYELLKDVKSLFTPKEKEILKQVTKGKTTKQIALFFNISPHTVSTHKKNILKKTDCKNIAELITKCIREGII